MDTTPSIIQIESDPLKMAKVLYKKSSAIKKWVRQNNGNKEDAEDLVQDAIVALLSYTKRNHFEWQTKPEGLLFAIARKMWFYELRKRNQKVNVPLDDLDTLENFDEEWYEKEQELRRAEKSLVQLGQKCRQILEMFYINKISMNAIAEKLGFRNEHVAKAMKYKCLEQARSLIKNK